MGQSDEEKGEGTMPEVTIQLSFRLPYKLVRKRKYVVSSCPVLDVWSQGETPEKAKKNLVEAITAFLITCFEMGTLEEVLKQCGLKPGKATHKTGREDGYINVPIPLLAEYQKGRACHA
jgi:predicted RNase H-like HicB family nuclease